MRKGLWVSIQQYKILSFHLGQPMKWGEADTRVLPKVIYFFSVLRFGSAPSPRCLAEWGTKLQAGVERSNGLGSPERSPIVCSDLSECGMSKYLAVGGGKVWVVNDSLHWLGLVRLIEARISENRLKIRPSQWRT